MFGKSGWKLDSASFPFRDILLLIIHSTSQRTPGAPSVVQVLCHYPRGESLLVEVAEEEKLSIKTNRARALVRRRSYRRRGRVGGDASLDVSSLLPLRGSSCRRSFVETRLFLRVSDARGFSASRNLRQIDSDSLAGASFRLLEGAP